MRAGLIHVVCVVLMAGSTRGEQAVLRVTTLEVETVRGSSAARILLRHALATTGAVALRLPRASGVRFGPSYDLNVRRDARCSKCRRCHLGRVREGPKRRKEAHHLRTVVLNAGCEACRV